MHLRWITESEVEPARALATGDVLLESVTDPGSPAAVLYGAGLTGNAVALGRWQRAEQALDLEAAQQADVEILRRGTGGPAAVAGQGILYCALCLRHASAFMTCPPDRILNRNVRGVLGGLSLSGVPAHYFGREWLSVARRPAAYIGWTRLADGRVLLEFFIAVSRPFAPGEELIGYPDRSDEPFLGKEPVTLAELAEQPLDPETMVRWIAEGHPSRFGSEVTPDQSSLTDEERRAREARMDTLRWTPPSADEQGAAPALRWSKPRPVPIGWVSAGASLDEDGELTDVQIAGDFYQDEEAPRILREKLVGREPSAQLYAKAVNSTWDASKNFIEGLKDLDPILRALLEAAPPR